MWKYKSVFNSSGFPVPHLNLVVHTPEIVYSTDIVVQKTSLDWTTSHFIRLADRLSLSNDQTTALIYSMIKTGGGNLNDLIRFEM